MKTSQLKRRRVRAILAGGAVLGVGAVVTMAAWSDSEFVNRAFAAGTFNLVSSIDGESFTDYEISGETAQLKFSMDALNLTPTDVAAAPFAVALDENTSYSAEVTLTSAGSDGDLDNLTYELLQTTDFGCSETTEGTALVRPTTALGTVPGEVKFTIPTPDEGRSQVNLCFKVTAGEDLQQGAAGNTTWEFAAQSQSS